LLGCRAKKLATALNLVSCFGATVCFLILVADIIAPAVASACTSSGGVFVCFFASSRIALISAFAFTIALPFSLADNMGHLVFASAIAAVSVFIIAGLLANQAAAAPAADHPKLFNASSALVLGIPISIFSFGNHTQVPSHKLLNLVAADTPRQVVPLFADLPANHRLRLMFHRSVVASNAMAFTLYPLPPTLPYSTLPRSQVMCQA
jgi:hypothetical protein